MALLRIQHIGVVVHDLAAACAQFERILGLAARDFRDDQGKGMQLDARILLGNECWLHLVQNWNPDSRVNRFLRERGEGLEHIALETDDIEGDVEHLREIGVPIFEDTIFDANDGYEAFVFPDQLPGLTVELIQSHERSWYYPPESEGVPISNAVRVERLEHIGLCVTDLDLARRRFDRLFGLASQELRDDRENGGRREARILLPNRCSLRLVEDHDPESRTRDYVDRRGEGMDHIALLTSDIDHDVRELRNRGVALSGQGDCGSSAGRGRAVWVDSDRLPGMAVELIAPRPRGSGAPLGDPRSGH